MAGNESKPVEQKGDASPAARSAEAEHTRRLMYASAFFKGPLPPPEILERYDRICPGFAQRILSMAEKESEHRRKMEQDVVAIQKDDLVSERRERRRGQWLGFILSVVAILGGVYAITVSPGIAGQIGGAFLSTSGLASLILALMTGKRGVNGDKDQGAAKPRG